MAELTVLRRCRGCGKWSTAKRDPIAHERWHDHQLGEDGGRFIGWFVWCGPFDRWTARHDDPKPRAELPHVGEPVRPHEVAEAKGTGPWRTLGEGEIPF